MAINFNFLKNKNISLGKEADLLRGSIVGGMLTFAIPVFIGQLFQQLYNAIDSMVAGNFISDNALASVSSSGNIIFLLIGFFNGLALGAGVIISREYGAGNYKRMRYAIHASLWLGIVFSLVLSVAGVVFTPAILRLVGTPEAILEGSVSYFRVYFMGATSMIMYSVLMGIMRAVGDSRSPLYYLIFSSVLNVILDLVFTICFHMDVAGLALATVIAQGISALLCIFKLARTKEIYRVDFLHMSTDKSTFLEIVKLGLPSAVQNSVIAFANTVVLFNVNSFEEVAVSGYGTQSKLEGFAFLPIMSFTMAISTFISQNLGAKQYDRAKKGAKFGIITSVILAEAIGAAYYFFGPVFISLFGNGAESAEIAARALRLVGPFYCLLAFSHCIASVLRGAGKAIVPMIVMLSSWCVLRVTYLTVTLSFIHEIMLVFLAYPITWTVSSVIFAIYYKKADWVHAFDKK